MGDSLAVDRGVWDACVAGDWAEVGSSEADRGPGAAGSLSLVGSTPLTGGEEDCDVEGLAALLSLFSELVLFFISFVAFGGFIRGILMG